MSEEKSPIKIITDYELVNYSPLRYLHYEIFNTNDKRICKKPFKIHHFVITCHEAVFWSATIDFKV